ncbi:N-6 DNA methylase [Mesoplasma melaleucae]|uniref:N-6 DNA methylase n=1 Tax=Mesoplasma melaleucae TaxID=81459 RepID=UPI0004881801|nr:N-6 DNA methylase [Mesoplasma melaleucae]
MIIYLSKKLRELTEEDIAKMQSLYDKHLNGEIINILGLAKTITSAELIENDYSFVPGRYVELEEEKVDKEEIKKEIKQLSLELTNLLSEFDELKPKLEEVIKKALESE